MFENSYQVKGVLSGIREFKTFATRPTETSCGEFKNSRHSTKKDIQWRVLEQPPLNQQRHLVESFITITTQPTKTSSREFKTAAIQPGARHLGQTFWQSSQEYHFSARL